VQDAAATLEPLRLELADAIGSAGSLKEALSAIARVRAKHANSTAIADAIFVPRAMADLAGQLMVHEHEAPGVVGEPMLRQVKLLALGDSQPLEAFLGLPWDEALDYYKGRGLTSERELSTLLKGHAEATKDARRDLLATVQERVNEMLLDAVEQGQSFEEFAEALAGEAGGLGITNQDPAYLQTVFRTNVLDAYGGGRAVAMNHPDVVAARPYRQIHTAGDGRVREEHVPLDGLVFRADGPLAGLRPPFGFNCRCSVTTMSEWDGEVATELPAGAVTPGFG
jgi:SPP1 gp7 family putative phage head morphogenesis protein